MDTTAPALAQLATALNGPDQAAALAAAWDSFDVALTIADAISWHNGYDELAALAAAESATAGRAILPVAGTRPIQLQDAHEVLPACAELLDAAAYRLQVLGDSEATADAERDAFTTAAGHATSTARSLRGAKTA